MKRFSKLSDLVSSFLVAGTLLTGCRSIKRSEDFAVSEEIFCSKLEKMVVDRAINIDQLFSEREKYDREIVSVKGFVMDGVEVDYKGKFMKLDLYSQVEDTKEKKKKEKIEKTFDITFTQTRSIGKNVEFPMRENNKEDFLISSFAIYINRDEIKGDVVLGYDPEKGVFFYESGDKQKINEVFEYCKDRKIKNIVENNTEEEKSLNLENLKNRDKALSIIFFAKNKSEFENLKLAANLINSRRNSFEIYETFIAGKYIKTFNSDRHIGLQDGFIPFYMHSRRKNKNDYGVTITLDLPENYFEKIKEKVEYVGELKIN